MEIFDEQPEDQQALIAALGGVPHEPPVSPATDEKLRVLRAIVDAGGPQQPVPSTPRITGTLTRGNTGARDLPFSDEVLARAKTLPQLLNQTPLGLLGDATDPMANVAASGPAVGLDEATRVAQKFLQSVGQQLPGRAFGSMARAMQKTGTPGEYAFKPDAVERLREFFKIGSALPSTSNWAGSTSDELLHGFGGDKAQALKWSRLWGATSPNTSVPRNTQESVSALIHAHENPGVPMTVEAAQTLPGMKITMAPSKVPNINRALAGEPLSGDKVEAMAGYMAGDKRIPIDVHALYAAGSKAEKLQPELPALRALMTKAEKLPLRGSLTDTDLYLRSEQAYAKAITDEIAGGRNLNSVFGTLWEGARAHKGLKHQGGPIDILRKKGLLQQGAMLDPDRLRAALKSQGWTAPAIAGLMAALPEGGGTGSKE